MDGKILLSLVNTRIANSDDLGDEIISTIRKHSNPAKLILDAIEGFYPTPSSPKIDISSVERFELPIVRKSCLLLLEQLVGAPRKITASVKKDAKLVAIEWRSKMTISTESEVLGFLLLICAYRLVQEFDGDEISSLFRVVEHHNLGEKLKGRLGCTNHSAVFAARLEKKAKKKQTLIASSSEPDLHRWIPPFKNCAKVNCDGSFILQSKLGGIGIVIRDDNGNIIAARAKRVPFVASAKLTELLAAREALEFASSLLGFNQPIEVEGDCKNAIAYLLGKKTPKSCLEKQIVMDAFSLAQRFSSCSFIFAKRLCNEVADAVAKYALGVESFEEWKGDDLLPSWLLQLCDLDKGLLQS